MTLSKLPSDHLDEESVTEEGFAAILIWPFPTINEPNDHFFMYEKRHCDQLFAQSRNVACVDFSLLGENAICSHNGGKILMGWNFPDICICERKVCNVSFGIVSLIKSVFLV